MSWKRVETREEILLNQILARNVETINPRYLLKLETTIMARATDGASAAGVIGTTFEDNLGTGKFTFL